MATPSNRLQPPPISINPQAKVADVKDLPTTENTFMTSGAQPNLSQTRTPRFLMPRDIATDAAFQFRQMGTDKAHAKSLAQTLRTVGDLDPVLVWQEVNADGQPVANRDYLTVYDSAGGQVMLAIVGGIFAFGGWLLTRMADIELPERFTARAGGPGRIGAET